MMSLSYIYSKILKKLRGNAIRNSRIDKTAVIYSGSSVSSSIIKKYSYCGYDCSISNTVIGAFCSISDHVVIGGAEHPMQWISTSPVFENVKHSGPTKRFSIHNLPPIKQTIIGNDVWIGHAATVKQGVCIGDGAVIGTGAIVTKDVPPYAIVVGCPAKIIKYRFNEETINRLLSLQWWNLSDDKLILLAPYIQDPKLFIDKLENL